ncbi:hypothetical protein KIW84_076159 [Lathyrus oleraceus]|uniref:Uncharacterized protein n=1 Tax=Pisum sativum TaxID=3888 RepID=A0A9D5A202_PEA|nr:hypothetical protein KIW84_076159 [Pisum sativum]
MFRWLDFDDVGFRLRGGIRSFRFLLLLCRLEVSGERSSSSNSIVGSWGWNILDASSGATLLSKYYEEVYKLIENITANTYQWPVSRFVPTPSQKKPVGVYEVTETTTLTAQIA